MNARGYAPPKFLAYTVILWLEKRCPKQNTFTRLKSNILAPPKKFWAGYATDVVIRINFLEMKVLHKKCFHLPCYPMRFIPLRRFLSIRQFPPIKFYDLYK